MTLSRQTILRGTALLLLAGLLATPASAEEPEATPGAAGESSEQQLLLEDLRTFADVFNIVRKHYVDEKAPPLLLEGALKGLMADLDEHSSYLPAPSADRQEQQSRGRYGGIGVEVEAREQRLVITEVFDSGPAYRAGVQTGDLILAIDELNVRGRSLPKAMDQLLGPPGSEVIVKLRSGKLPPREVTLVREQIRVPSVRAELLEERIAYLRVTHFHLGTASEFERALNRLQAEAETPLAGIVMDLRDNPGGVIRGATRLADGFLESGLVVYSRGRYPSSQFQYHAEPGEWAPGTPVLVLVNGGSASASEILAGALQDHGRATLIGSRTYGKGTIQSVLQLRNGAAVKLTTARYFTPSGRLIDQVGIEPDITRKGESVLAPGTDWELAEALEQLAGEAPDRQR